MYKIFSSIAATIAVTGTLFTTLASPASAQDVLLSERGFLDPSQYADYYIDGNEGQVLTLTLGSRDFDTYITLYSPDGRVLAENDDYDGTNSTIESVELPRNGTYRVVVTGYDFDQRGRYDLTVYATAPSLPPISLSERGFLDSGRYVDYDFYGYGGQNIAIELSSLDFDTRIEVYDQRNRLIADNDDWDGNSNSRLDLSLPYEGSYRVLVQGYSDADTGRFNLNIYSY